MSNLAAPCRASSLTVVIHFILVSVAHAAITTTGDVTPDPSTTTLTDDLFIGDTSVGTMLVEAISVVESFDAIIGNEPGVIGVATIDGTGSAWRIDNSLYVGYEGIGTLTMTDRARLFNNEYALIGYQLGSTGTLVVSGDGSYWENHFSVLVGWEGNGTIYVTDGGDVRSLGGIIGVNTNGNGVTTINGTGSTWTILTSFTVGHYGVGTLNVTDGAQVFSNGAFIGGISFQSTGTVTIDGDGSTWTNESLLILGNFGTGTLSITGGGTVHATSSMLLGSHAYSVGILNLVEGTLKMEDSTLSRGDGIGVFNFIGGRLEGAGTVDLDTTLVQHGGTLAPGNSAGTTLIEGGYTLQAGAIEIEIDGLGTAGTDWDLVQVNGTVDLLGDDATADGLVEVILGFAPSVSDEFLILDNDGADAILGTFAQGLTLWTTYDVNLYEFAIDYTAGDGNDIVLTTTAVSILGDFNFDGSVDAADYPLWRSNPSAFGGAQGYTNWVNNFGQTAGSGFGSSARAAVPEPNTAAHTILAGLILCGVRCRSECPRLKKLGNS